MITQNLSQKLEGSHHEAFRLIARRLNAHTNRDCIKRLIEDQLEFKAVENLRLNLPEHAEPSCDESKVI